MHKYMTDLGLSPSSRSHVSAAPKLGPPAEAVEGRQRAQ